MNFKKRKLKRRYGKKIFINVIKRAEVGKKKKKNNQINQSKKFFLSPSSHFFSLFSIK